MAPGQAWQTLLKKTEIELKNANDIDILQMLRKRIRGGRTRHVVLRFVEVND